MSLTKTKEVLALLATVLALAIGPEKNQALLFDASPTQQYGELTLFSNDSLSYVLCKNSSDSMALWQSPVKNRLWSRSTLNGTYSEFADSNVVPPHSFGFLKLAQPNALSKQRIVSVGNSAEEPIRSLTVITSSERQWEFILVALATILIVIFTIITVTWGLRTLQPLLPHR